MLCDICKKGQATVHLTEIVNEKVVEMHICPHCAKAKTQEIKEQFSAPNLFGGLLESSAVACEKALVCPNCGLHYKDFKKKGRFGCGNCYIAFREQVVPLLRNIHGSARYQGKVPVNLHSRLSKEKHLQQLRLKLGRAVELEAYEEAAFLRDEIKKLEA
jgi:protein arginine kinase activator